MEKEMKKRNVYKILTGLLLVVVVLFALNAGVNWANEKTDIPEEISIGSELEETEVVEETFNEVVNMYLNSIISDAFTRGTESALKQIISFAQETNEDGTIKPLCDNVIIGDVQLINIACLQAEVTE